MKLVRRWFLLLIGIIIFIVGIIMLFNHTSLDSNYNKLVHSTVIDIVEEEKYMEKDNKYKIYYYPIIEYQVGKKDVSVKFRESVSKDKYNIGDVIDIYYNSKKIDEFILKNEVKLSFLPKIIIISGLLISFMGIIIAFLKR